MSYFWIFVGGGVGSVARVAASTLIGRHLGESFPWGTLFVNLTGCFVIGFLFEFSGPESRAGFSPTVRQLLIAGICGGYTTFSAFSLQTLLLAKEGQFLKAATYTVLSVFLCLIAVWLGQFLVASVNSARPI